MNTKYELNMEILSSIDNIDDVVMESDDAVMSAMLDVYTKQLVILENCSENTDVSSFEIFQESFIMEADDETGGDTTSTDSTTKKTNIIIRILTFIPRMIMKFIKFIKSKWDNRASQRLLKRLDELEHMNEKQRSELQRIADENHREHRDMKADISIHDVNIDRLHHNSAVNDMRIDDVNKKIDRSVEEVEIKFAKKNTDNYLRDLELSTAIKKIGVVVDYKNGKISTCVLFDTCIKTLELCAKFIKSTDQWDLYKPSTITKSLEMIKINSDARSFVGNECIESVSYIKDIISKYDALVENTLDEGRRSIKRINSLLDVYKKNVAEKKNDDNKIAAISSVAADGIKGVNKCISDCMTIMTLFRDVISSMDRKVNTLWETYSHMNI